MPTVSVVDEATSETDARRKLQEKHVDVVLLDLSLQNLNAIELTRQIRQSHPTARVLICTGFRRVTDIFTALDAGKDGYVLKENHKGLEVAINSVRLGTVWLDPGIAAQVLAVMASATTLGRTGTRTLPTGRIRISCSRMRKTC
jgi:DNA-binding NarL/FixJ family response regulator